MADKDGKLDRFMVTGNHKVQRSDLRLSDEIQTFGSQTRSCMGEEDKVLEDLGRCGKEPGIYK